MSGQIADKDWFLDAEGNLTDSGETGASYLVREGQEITAEMAEKYDFSKVAQPEGEEADETEGAESEESPDATKADSPKGNKAEKPAGNNKGVK